MRHKHNRLEPLGLSPCGQPLEPLSELAKKLALRPRQHLLKFCLDKAGRPLLESIVEGVKNEAAWGQTRGVLAPHPCTCCAFGQGPFSTCVTVGKRCSNCHFDGASCSFCKSATSALGWSVSLINGNSFLILVKFYFSRSVEGFSINAASVWG